MKARFISQETVYLYHIGLNSQRDKKLPKHWEKFPFK